jgi:hypothetical protein
MPVDLSGLPAQDRQDFEKRLAVYGLDASHVQDPLLVNPGARAYLAYGPGRESVREPHVLRTTDIAAVKRMVGIDDRVFRTAASRVPLPGMVEVGRLTRGAERERPGIQRDAGSSRFTAAPGQPLHDDVMPALDDADLNLLDTEQVANVRVAARAFVRGQSELVASYRPLIERVVGPVIVPIFCLFNVKVPSGSVLEFGPGVNVLVAHEVEIENGGVIRSRGHLTVNCTSLKSPGQFRPGLVRALGPVRLAGTFRPIFSE